MALKPFRFIPKDIAEWTRWMMDQDVVSSGDVSVSTTTTTETSDTDNADQALVYFLEY